VHNKSQKKFEKFLDNELWWQSLLCTKYQVEQARPPPLRQAGFENSIAGFCEKVKIIYNKRITVSV
jgi:hypothetical protein